MKMVTEGDVEVDDGMASIPMAVFWHKVQRYGIVLSTSSDFHSARGDRRCSLWEAHLQAL